MSNNQCAVCGKPVTPDQAAIEHIVPLSQGGKNIETNTRTVHITCHRRKLPLWKRIMRRIGYWRWKLIMWLDSWGYCPKEEQGYRCRHQIMSNGKKECGDD